MYLGLAIMLLGWAVFLSNPASLLVIGGFVYYIDRFQIVPEEKVLDAIFDADFQAYRRNVRRWL